MVKLAGGPSPVQTHRFKVWFPQRCLSPSLSPPRSHRPPCATADFAPGLAGAHGVPLLTRSHLSLVSPLCTLTAPLTVGGHSAPALQPGEVISSPAVLFGLYSHLVHSLPRRLAGRQAPRPTKTPSSSSSYPPPRLPPVGAPPARTHIQWPPLFSVSHLASIASIATTTTTPAWPPDWTTSDHPTTPDCHIRYFSPRYSQ